MDEQQWGALHATPRHLPFVTCITASCPQDFLASLILCECVYKKVELSQEDLRQTISAMLCAFPPGWVQLDAVEISRSDLQQQ